MIMSVEICRLNCGHIRIWRNLSHQKITAAVFLSHRKSNLFLLIKSLQIKKKLKFSYFELVFAMLELLPSKLISVLLTTKKHKIY